MAENIVQTLIGLGIVIVSIFAIAWFVSRFGRGTLLASSNMRIVGNLPLGARERVVVVEVGDQQIMLGVTPQAINTLHVFATPVLGQSTVGQPKDGQGGGRELSDFRKKLQDILSKGMAR